MWWNYIQTPHEARAEKCVCSGYIRFIRTPHYNGQFALSLGKESSFLTFSLIKNQSAIYLRTLSMAHSVSVLTGFDLASVTGVRKGSEFRARRKRAIFPFLTVLFLFFNLPSRAISHARGHLRISRFARRTTEKREAARSLLTPRFTDFFTDFEKKTACFAV